MQSTNLNHTQEAKKVSTYLVIGLFTTFCTWIIWNILIYVFENYTNLDPTTGFSVAQYTSAFIMIFPSFYLNRILTFKDNVDRSGKLHVSTLKAYGIYTISPLVASVSTFLVLKLIPGLLTFKLSFLPDLEVGKLGLQAFGIGIGMVINYLGQRLWIYK